MKYFSMFSGIGGFELGLENSFHHFENVGYSEIDKYAESIYRRHFPNHVGFGDATELETDEIDDFELLVGGFPCQAFSLSGKRQGFDDTRGTLFFEIARVLKDKRPRYFLLENVKGLLSHDGGRTFKTMLGVLSELGYNVEWQNYNSKDYGTAQNRERIYIKGYLGREGGREILSRRRSDRETLNKVNTLVKNKQANSIHSIDGTSVTLCGEAGGQGGKTGLYAVPFNRQVRKRVHTVDYGELSEWLREHKKNANLSNKEISEKLDKPLSEVEHWFRTDEYFSPPSADVWFEFKELLNISDETYDAFITEYELVDGVYEIDKRAYDENGLAPTIQTNGGSLAKINVVGNLSSTNHCGADVFSEESLSRSLSATDWKHPKMVAEGPKIKKVGNISNTGHNGKNVYGSDGLCPTLCSDSVPKNGLNIVEECIASTQKHSARTDGTYSPTLTEAMGKGGGHIPMIKLKDEPFRKINKVGSTNGHQSGDVFGSDGLSPTLCGMNQAKSVTKIIQSDEDETLKVRTNTKKGYDEVISGDGVRIYHPTSTKARGRTQKGGTGALSTSSDWGTVDKDFRIRRLTPKECERLQAFPDDWTKYGADGELISDTQRYRCLGNAVTTTVVTHIANTMFVGDF